VHEDIENWKVLEYTRLCIPVSLIIDARCFICMKINGMLCTVRMEEEVIIKKQIRYLNGGYANSPTRILPHSAKEI